jgi:hypothetical protein
MSEYSAAPVIGVPLQRPATTGETIYSRLGRLTDPLVAMFQYNHGAVRQDFDRSVDPIYAPIATELYLVPTKKEFEVKKRLFLNDQADRKTFQNSTYGQLAVAGLADPTNALPIVKVLKATTAISSAVNLGVTAGAITTAEEVLRSSQMAGYDPMEGAFNIGASVILGGSFGAGIYGARKTVSNAMDSAHKRLGQHQQTIREMESFVERQDTLREMAKGRRPLGNENEEILRTRSILLSNQINGKSQTIERIQSGKLDLSEQAAESIQREVDSLIIQRGQVLDELNMRRLDEGLYTVDDPFGVASSFFDWVDILPTPMKNIARFKIPKNASSAAKEAINRFKKSSMLLAGDSSMLYAGQKLGLTLPPSVHIQNQLRKADVINAENQLTKLWREATDAPFGPATAIRKISKSGPTLDEWINEINAKRMKQDVNLSPKEKEAIQVLDNYFNKIRIEGEEFGVLGNAKFIESKILETNGRLGEARTKLDDSRQKNASDRIEYWEGKTKQLEQDVAELQNSLQYINSAPVRPAGVAEPYFLRQWNQVAVAADEKGPRILRQRLTDFIRENPYGLEYNNKSGLYEPRDLTGDIQAQDRYVDSVIKSIISDNDPSSSATSRSTKYASRSIMIPNSQVLDFINTNAREVMRTYSMRVGTKIDFAKQFGNRTYNDLADELVGDLVDGGVSLKEANMLRKNLTVLYQRITATTLSDPTSFTNRSVQFLKEFTSLNYLGGAGVTTIGDIPKVIMENGFKTTLKGAFASLDSKAWQKQIGEIKTVYAEALELSLGTTQQQMIEDTGTQVGSRAWTQIKDAGFILNALGPMTVALKSLSGSLSVHRFIEISERVADGSASKFELEYAGRYNLSISQLKEIASKAPTEKTPNGLNVGNITEWAEAGVSTDTILAFRAAVSNNVGNTILSSTPATRFTYADGSIFLNINAARKIMPNIKEAEDFPGYVRWESSVMTLPFQFYNFSMSATTNILQTAAQGQIKSRYAGFASMLGMGYMISKLKTPEWAWNDMSYEEKFMSAVERSGVAAVYGDIALNSIRVGTQLGLNDPENDFAKLPFYGKEGYMEAATTILGAGSSTIKDFVDTSARIPKGEYAEALKEFYLMLPLTELFWMKEDSRSMIDYASKSIFDDR